MSLPWPTAGWSQTWNAWNFSLSVENSGNSVQSLRKIVKVVLVRRSDICVKQLLIGVHRILHCQSVVVTCYAAGVGME